MATDHQLTTTLKAVTAIGNCSMACAASSQNWTWVIGVTILFHTPAPGSAVRYVGRTRGLFSTAGMRSRSTSANSRAAKRVAVSTGTPTTTTSSPRAAEAGHDDGEARGGERQAKEHVAGVDAELAEGAFHSFDARHLPRSLPSGAPANSW
jgi:hypothetical protein